MANTMAHGESLLRVRHFARLPPKMRRRRALQARLRALSQAHAVLVQSSWQSSPMQTVVEEALAPYRSGEGRITISGPAVDLPARQSLSLALALHELATNATKYGALSVPDGKLDVTWSVTQATKAPVLDFCWRELGGPEVSPPTRRGFGSQLIETTLQADFGECRQIDYAPAGLVCSFSARLAGFEAKAEPQSVR